jgi:hypothetical protein
MFGERRSVVVTRSFTSSKSPIARDIASLIGSNAIARVGSLLIAILLARATRSLSEEAYAMTFTAIAGAQMMISLDLGVGSLAVDLAARGIDVYRVVGILKKLRARLRNVLLCSLPVAAVAEYFLLSQREGESALHLDVGVAVLVALQVALVGVVIHFGAYERILYGARSASQLSRASIVGLVFSGAVLFAAMNLPSRVVPALAIVAVFGGLFVSRAISRRHVRNSSGFTASEDPGSVSAEESRRARSFWILQLCGVTAFGFDQLVVAALRPSEAAGFAAHSRYFQIGASVLSVVITSVWPPMSAAISRRDFLGARRLYLLAAGIVAAAATIWSVPLVAEVFSVSLFKVGEENNLALLAPMALWFVVFQVGALLGQVQAAVRDLRYQIKTACRMSIANVVLSVVLCWRFGSVGVIWGSLISYPALVLIPVLRRFQDRSFWLKL